MAKITYVLNVHNHSKTLPAVFHALKILEGNFRKEFIIFDDNSTDNSLKLIKALSPELANVTIITNSKLSDSFKKNYGLYIANGEFIQFLNGDTILEKDSSVNLLDVIHKYDTKLAFGEYGYYNKDNLNKKHDRIKENENLITDPLSSLFDRKKNILDKTIHTSLISNEILSEAFDNPNTEIINNYTIALRCSLHTKFAYCPKIISYIPENNKSEFSIKARKMDIYNKMLAISEFIDSDVDSSIKHSKDIYKTIIHSLFNFNKKDFSSFSSYIKSKIYVPKMDIDNLKNYLDSKIIQISKKI